jgi:hypothetical protein
MLNILIHSTQSRYDNGAGSDLWTWQTCSRKPLSSHCQFWLNLQRNRHILWHITKIKCLHLTLMLSIPCNEVIFLIYKTKICTYSSCSTSLSWKLTPNILNIYEIGNILILRERIWQIMLSVWITRAEWKQFMRYFTILWIWTFAVSSEISTSTFTQCGGCRCRFGSRSQGYHPVAPRPIAAGPLCSAIKFRLSSPETLHMRHERPY